MEIPWSTVAKVYVGRAPVHATQALRAVSGRAFPGQGVRNVSANEPTLQIEEDRAYQRREWRIERIGWALMALMLLAGLLGLLGYGPLSRTQVGTPGTLAVAYDRLQRSSAPSNYRFEVAPALARNGQLRLRFDNVLLEEVEMNSILPEPSEVRSGAGYTEFVFAMDAAAGPPARIQFQFHPATFGHVRGRISTDGAAPLLIDQIILP
jgi:hypothetical protein